MTAERIETVVIGGGQAGLTMSHCLSQRGMTHVVLERHRIAERWRSERWDSLRFQFPNWAMRLPDFHYSGDDPDSYAHRDEVIRFIEAYADYIRAPVRTGVNVRTLRRDQTSNRFLLATDTSTIEADNVVVATGPYQKPVIPSAAEGLAGTFQIAASAYRNPAQLPPGAILVVGAGASGCQIAEDLMQAGRTVFLSVGPHRRVPRRYRGKDIIWWINTLGMDEKIADENASRQAPLIISGANGGRTIDLRGYAASGMVLLGRVIGARDGSVTFASDLATNLAAGDASYANFVRNADAYAARSGLVLPDEPNPGVRHKEPRSDIETLDLRASRVGAVIWATGYRYEFDWIDLDVFAPRDGASVRSPLHRRGVTQVPGAYFLGLPLLHKTKSSFLSGVGEDSAYLANHIAARHRTRRAET
jgi:putative flavoprotein involved in K+ transport